MRKKKKTNGMRCVQSWVKNKEETNLQYMPGPIFHSSATFMYVLLLFLFLLLVVLCTFFFWFCCSFESNILLCDFLNLLSSSRSKLHKRKQWLWISSILERTQVVLAWKRDNERNTHTHTHSHTKEKKNWWISWVEWVSEWESERLMMFEQHVRQKCDWWVRWVVEKIHLHL